MKQKVLKLFQQTMYQSYICTTKVKNHVVLVKKVYIFFKYRLIFLCSGPMRPGGLSSALALPGGPMDFIWSIDRMSPSCYLPPRNETSWILFFWSTIKIANIKIWNLEKVSKWCILIAPVPSGVQWTPQFYQVARSWNCSKEVGIPYSPIVFWSEMFKLQFI